MAYLYDLWIPDPSADKISRLIKEEAGTVIVSEHKPMAVAVHTNQLDVYVANAGANTIKYKNGVALPKTENASGTISRYRDGAHMDDIVVGRTPMGIAVGPDGVVWVANYGSCTVSKVVNNKVTATIPVGLGPRGICVTPKGIVYVSNYLGNTVTKIVNDVVTATIKVAWNPYGICADRFENVYVCCSGSNLVTKIKDNTRLKDINVGHVPYGICLDMNGTVWVANYYAGTINKLVDDKVDGDAIMVGKGAFAIDVDRDNEIFVTNYLEGTVSKVSGGAEVTKIKVTPNPCAFGDFSGMQAYYLFEYGTGGSGVTKKIGYDDLDPAMQRMLDNLKPITLPIEDTQVNHSNDANYATVNDALNHLLNPAPVIESFTIDKTVFEMGTVVNDLTFSWKVNKTMDKQSIGSYGDIPSTDMKKALSGLGLKTNSKFTLTVSDTDGRTATADASIKFQLSNYIGTLKSATPTNAELLLLRHILSDDAAMQNQYVNATGGKYIYIAVPATYGLDVSRIMVGDHVCTDWTVSPVQITNANGYAATYTLFRSNRIQTASDIKIDVIV